jgi:ankyrin repeat protein
MESEALKAFAAVRAGDREALHEVLTTRPDLAGSRDDQGLSLLLQAMYFQRTDMVERLVEASPPIGIFEAAALPSMTDRAALLVQQDPSLVDAWSGDGFTALHLAAYFGRTEVARLLLAHGADADAVSRNTMSLRPLHSAAASRSHEIMKLLLDAGACVDAQQHGGWTALHAVAGSADLVGIGLLLAGGADPRRGNDEGKSPLDLATEKGHVDAIRLLQSKK